MNEVLELMFRDGTAVGEDGSVVEVFPTGVMREDGKALYDVVRAVGAKRTLEIGFAYGISTLFILQALKDSGGGHHTAIDPFEVAGFGNIGNRNVQQAGFDDMFTFHHTYSQDLLPQFLIAGEKYDFIFIDGHHTFDDTLNDFYYCDKIVHDGGIIVFHDFKYYPSVRKVINFILRNMNYESAMDLIYPPVGRLTRLARTAKLMWNYPWDPYCWHLANDWARSNVYIIRRQGPDPRRFDHYRPF